MINKAKILHELKIHLKNTFNDRIDNVVLFGSQTRNKKIKYSVFDILITTKDLFSWQDKSVIRDICYDISIDFGILINSKIISQFEIKTMFRGKHPLITDALNLGIHAE